MGKFDNYLFRASQVGRLMTASRTKDPIGETCKKYLHEVYIKEVYGRDKDIMNKYIMKGLQCEEDSLTLYSRAIKTPFFKNDKWLSNEFISGTPDVITDTEVIDMKSSWSIHTFFDVLTDSLNKNYFYQLQCYMALTGLKSAKLVYCLVSTPDALILDEIQKLKWKMGVSDPDANEVFQQAAAYLETTMKYEDIPLEKRYIEFTIEYDQSVIDQIYEKVSLCRSYLNQL